MAYAKETAANLRTKMIELIEKLDSDRSEELLKHADRLANPAKLPDGINSRFAVPKSPEDNG